MAKCALLMLLMQRCMYAMNRTPGMQAVEVLCVAAGCTECWRTKRPLCIGNALGESEQQSKQLQWQGVW
jgi:hypothetical protein